MRTELTSSAQRPPEVSMIWGDWVKNQMGLEHPSSTISYLNFLGKSFLEDTYQILKIYHLKVNALEGFQ